MVWWSFSNEKIGPQLFHRDYESFNEIICLFNRVGKENGLTNILFAQT